MIRVVNFRRIKKFISRNERVQTKRIKTKTIIHNTYSKKKV